MLIRDVTLWDGLSDRATPRAAVRVEGGTIVAVGAAADFGDYPDDPFVLDGTGLFLMPGLINSHIHLGFMYRVGHPASEVARGPAELTIHGVRIATVLLAQGITTAREMGGKYGVPFAIRDAIARGEMVGPRIVACGEPLSVTGGHFCQTCMEADGSDDFLAAARAQLKAGADHIKVMASHDPLPMPGAEKTRAEARLDEIAAAFDAAHEWGKFASCHVMGSRAIERVLQAGADIIDHGHYLTRRQAEQMAARGVVFSPTLSSYDVQTMHPRFLRGQAWADEHAVLVEAHASAMRSAVAAGVTCIVGTDTVGCYAEEVDLLRQHGLTAVESLRACTSHAARALRLAEVTGAVVPGLAADLVLLRANPFENPYALEEVECVIKGGVVHRPQDLLYLDQVGTTPAIQLARHPGVPAYA